MPRSFLIAVFLFAFFIVVPALAASSLSADKGAVQAGSLMCFSVTPPRDRQSSCDLICTEKGAACVSLQMDGAVSPGFGCADALDKFRGAFAVVNCRCCALAR